MAKQPPSLGRDIADHGDPEVRDDEFINLYDSTMAETLESLPAETRKLLTSVTAYRELVLTSWEGAFRLHAAICSNPKGWKSRVRKSLEQFYQACHIYDFPLPDEDVGLWSSKLYGSLDNPIDNVLRFARELRQLVWPDLQTGSDIPPEEISAAVKTIRGRLDVIRNLVVPRVTRQGLELSLREIRLADGLPPEEKAKLLSRDSRSPAITDDDAYVSASKLWAYGFPTYKKFKKWLDDQPASTIRRRKPSKNKLLIHAVDFIRACAVQCAKGFDQLDDASAEQIADVEAQKATAHAAKSDSRI